MYLVKKQLHDLSKDPARTVEAGLISVILPVHSLRVNALATALRSVDAQSYDRMEILIVNNGVTPKSVFAELPQLKHTCRILDFDKNLGASYGRNAGALASRGEFIWFVDSDVTAIHKDCVSHAVTVLRENPRIGAVGGIKLGTSERSRFVVGRVSFPSSAPQPSERLLVEDTYVNTACVVLSRHVFFKVRGFTEYIEYLHDDNDFGFKILAAGYRCVGCPLCAALHPVRTGETTFRYEFMAFKNTLLYLFVNYTWPEFRELLKMKDVHPDVSDTQSLTTTGRRIRETLKQLAARFICLFYLAVFAPLVVRHRMDRQSFLMRLRTENNVA